MEAFADLNWLEAYKYESAYGRQVIIMSLRTDTNLDGVSNVWVAPISREHCSLRFLGKVQKKVHQIVHVQTKLVSLLRLSAAYCMNKACTFLIQRLDIGWNIRPLLDLKTAQNVEEFFLTKELQLLNIYIVILRNILVWWGRSLWSVIRISNWSWTI